MNCDDCLVFTFQSVFLLPSNKKSFYTPAPGFKFLTLLLIYEVQWFLLSLKVTVLWGMGGTDVQYF